MIKSEGDFSMPTKMRAKRTDLRSPRQKYCERWEEVFPWLKSDKSDECLGICTICDARLVCKKSHLERHQNSIKHQRAMGFEIAKTDDIFIEDIKDREFDEFEEETEEAECSNPELEETAILPKKMRQAIKTLPKKRLSGLKEDTSKEQRAKLIRLKLLKRIDRDRNELNEYYYARQKSQSGNFMDSPAQQRDTFDLFFESISASVKVLPLKLGYEFKSKVSQLLSEFELRALCEKEARENASRELYQPTSAPVIVSPAFDEDSKTITSPSTPQVVYSFQAK